MRLSKILFIVGMIITIVSLVLFFLFGELWLTPLLVIAPCCLSRSRFRVENRNEPPTDEYDQDEESRPPGETAPFVDLAVEGLDIREKRCPKCHILIEEENVRYCPNCGNKLVK
jgi:ssDNA-binding Zn-finger/Zn-ribbon topoisomerase 1